MSNNEDKKLEKLKAWHQAAASKREQNAKLAGVSTNTVDFAETTKSPKGRRPTSHPHKDSTAGTRDSQPEAEHKDARKSMMATRISQPEKGIDMYYHEPVKVRFNSKHDVRT